MNKELLIVFAKNFVEGKVKTRLAISLGDAMALQVYRKLCDHTLAITRNFSFDKVIYYSDFVPVDDNWSQLGFEVKIQSGENLGQRMRDAFVSAFEKGYSSVVIIGTDCHELNPEIILEAFAALQHNDTVIGPAKDGGYYLLGMKRFYEALFDGKQWGSSTVYKDTVDDFRNMNLSCSILPTLSDIDTEEDLKQSRFLNDEQHDLGYHTRL